MTKLFPTVLIILDICASVPYAFHCDWKKTVYWLAAAPYRRKLFIEEKCDLFRLAAIKEF